MSDDDLDADGDEDEAAEDFNAAFEEVAEAFADRDADVGQGRRGE